MKFGKFHFLCIFQNCLVDIRQSWLICMRILRFSFFISFRFQWKCTAGWSSGNTLAYHTGDPALIPRRGGSSEKVWEYLRWFFISRLQPSKPDTGVYKRDWWRRTNYLCSHCFLWPGTIKSWWKPSPGQTDQLHTLQHSPHTCIHKWREGKWERYVLRS